MAVRLNGIIVLLALLLNCSGAAAQCITSFPYYESFQNNNGGWQPGGTNSDWAWGDIYKASSNIGGRGWSTGGLNGGSYNNGENSWLQSPCFDFTGMQNPQISFNVFWETERQFDGASFQYSTDNGNTWITVGSPGEAANCFTGNWYNTPGVTYLTGKPGWSGSMRPTSGSCLGGNGSGGWVLAKHDLGNLAGKPQVYFRFTFGAGTACNAYDGFGIDDILINERAVNIASFNYNCGSNRIVSFVNTSSVCAQSYSWNFGDPASGTQNINAAKNPDHTFSAPGTYNVALTVTFSDNTIFTTTKQVTVLGVDVTPTYVTCFGGQNGTATASVTGGNGNYTYLWNTTPAQTTATATALKAGIYTVTVSQPQGCSTSANINITEPEKLAATLNVTDERCSNHEGGITTNVQGGVQPYTYQWSDGSTANALQHLNAGKFTVNVTDANGCTSASTATVKNIANPISLFLGNDTIICPGETLVLNPGSFAIYQWQDGSANSSFTVKNTGIYSVKVNDADGCTATDAINVTVDCSDIVFPTAFTPNNDKRNDVFGAAGNTALIKNYSLKVYSRWADVIFQTTDPAVKWDGTVEGIPSNTGTFVWIATYELLGKKRIQKGTVLLIR